MVGSHGGNATPIDRNLANQVGSDHFSWLWQKTGPVSNIHYGVAINLYLYYCSCRDQRRMIGSPLDPPLHTTVHTDQSLQYKYWGSNILAGPHLQEKINTISVCIYLHFNRSSPRPNTKKMLYFSCWTGGWWLVEYRRQISLKERSARIYHLNNGWSSSPTCRK